MRSVLVWLMVLCGGIAVPTPARGDGPACRPAELFATDNIAVISDISQLHDELQLFEIQADATIALNGAAVTGSTLVDGVFWSDELQQSTYERSREFHLCSADEPTLHTLHTIAEALRLQFDQEAVLTFEYLPRHAPEVNAIIIDAPDIDIVRFRNAFLADPAAHHRLLGGSVTTTDHTLVLVAGNDDLDIARRLVGEAGGNWNAVAIAYGKREFVQT